MEAIPKEWIGLLSKKEWIMELIESNWNQLGNGLVSLSAKLSVSHMDIDKNVILSTLLYIL